VGLALARHPPPARPPPPGRHLAHDPGLSPQSHIPAAANRAYLTIEQSYRTLHITPRTAESVSRSSNASLGKANGSGVSELRFLYGNTPQVIHRQRSPCRTGACRPGLATERPPLRRPLHRRRHAARLDDRTADCSTYAEATAADATS
jgi:hypothetical protein